MIEQHTPLDAVMSKNLVGIDLGTTFSSLTCLDSGLQPRPVANVEGEFATPSVVYIKEDGEGAVVGTKAIELGMDRPERFAANAKRYLGQPNVNWDIDGVLYSPVDILSVILAQTA